MEKYYTNDKNELYANPILENHKDLREISKTEFDALVVAKNKPTAEQELQKSLNEAQTLLNDTDFYIIRKFEEDIAIPEDILIARADAKKLLRDNDISYTK